MSLELSLGTAYMFFSLDAKVILGVAGIAAIVLIAFQVLDILELQTYRGTHN